LVELNVFFQRGGVTHEMEHSGSGVSQVLQFGQTYQPAKLTSVIVITHRCDWEFIVSKFSNLGTDVQKTIQKKFVRFSKAGEKLESSILIGAVPEHHARLA
jgi:hypothetical protein